MTDHVTLTTSCHLGPQNQEELNNLLPSWSRTTTRGQCSRSQSTFDLGFQTPAEAEPSTVHQDWLTEVTFPPVTFSPACGACRPKPVGVFAGRGVLTGAVRHQQSAPSPIVPEHHPYWARLPMPRPRHTAGYTPEPLSCGAADRRAQQVLTSKKQ